MSKALLDDLRARGLIFQLAGEDDLPRWLDGGMRTLYCGFDPTADSLHIGSLVPLVMLRRFQFAGHKPLALVGGATGLIGDPSFKAQERQLNTPDVINGWVEKIAQQISRFIDPSCMEIWRSAVYRFHALLAERWRHGRVFLLGDACHQTLPRPLRFCFSTTSMPTSDRPRSRRRSS